MPGDDQAIARGDVPLPAWAANEPYGHARRPSSIPRSIEPTDTGVQSLDRSIAILTAVERGAATLNHLIAATGLPKPTTYRLARALEAHGLLARDPGGSWRLGPELFALATAARRDLPLASLARPALDRLAEATGESAQLYIRHDDSRLCIAASESNEELRTIVPVGAALPLTAGSAAIVFLAFATIAEQQRLLQGAEAPEWRAGGAPWKEKILLRAQQVHKKGFAWSVEDRGRGVASVSAPVFSKGRTLEQSGPGPTAVVSISGPVGRLGRTPGNHYAPAVMAAAREIERALGRGDP